MAYIMERVLEAHMLWLKYLCPLISLQKITSQHQHSPVCGAELETSLGLFHPWKPVLQFWWGRHGIVCSFTIKWWCQCTKVMEVRIKKCDFFFSEAEKILWRVETKHSKQHVSASDAPILTKHKNVKSYFTSTSCPPLTSIKNHSSCKPK